jgi:hypothetical protein
MPKTSLPLPGLSRNFSLYGFLVYCAVELPRTPNSSTATWSSFGSPSTLSVAMAGYSGPLSTG